jgi:archaellum biogenesis protein FlaJ (TadC family)
VKVLQEQNYRNHRRFDPKYHYVLMPLSFIVLVGTIVALINNVNSRDTIWLSVLSLMMSIVLFLAVTMIRAYPLRMQDRIIRAEQQLRHYILVGQLLDPSLTLKQIIGLRFASDAEFPELCKRAVKEKLTGGQIKRLIKEWNGDNDRI